MKPVIEQLEKLYITNIRGNVAQSDKDDVQEWIDAFQKDGAKKSFMILTRVSDVQMMARNHHLRYLWRFNRKNTIATILGRIENVKLWEKPTNVIFYSFEDLFNYCFEIVNNPKVKYIGQLAIYDLSIHLALLWRDCNLMPKEYVYIHALPKKSYNRLVREGIIKKFVIYNGKIKTVDIKPYFPHLQADEIEDLLCWVGKIIREIDKDCNQVNLANIIKYAQKQFSINLISKTSINKRCNKSKRIKTSTQTCW